VAAKKAEAKPKAPGENGAAKKAPVEIDPDSVPLGELLKEANIGGQAARRKLRAAKLARSGRWAWKKGSTELKAAREALGLDK
jgi:hypothetical protein